MINLNLEKFISKYITERNNSLFHKDILDNRDALYKTIGGKSLLVIGGAGTIGSSFIKEALKYDPARLYVVDTSENGLTELTRDLRSSFNINVPVDYKTYPVNYNDDIFFEILQNEGPFEIIANFAAHKHVRSEKDIYSVKAMIANNVIYASKLLDKLSENPPEHFFCVSTDKAANPVNIMGASKKLMEEVIMSFSGWIPVSTARFANVAFSNGSLPAGFIERIQKRQPLSAPNDVKRYFVSPAESGQICLLACILGESGDIFFPKLTEEQMMKFTGIADSFLSELGFKSYRCSSEEEAKEAAAELDNIFPGYPVYYFGSDTSGEKSFEEFYSENEITDMSRFESLGIVKNAVKRTPREIADIISRLSDALHNKNIGKQDIVSILEDFLPNFNHIETGKNLDQKM